jgi:hypothetical protein
MDVVRKEERRVFGHGCVRSDWVVVKHAGAFAVPNIQRELNSGRSFPERGKYNRQYKRILILPRQRDGDVVECLFRSHKLNNSERGQHLDGCPLLAILYTVSWFVKCGKRFEF